MLDTIFKQRFVRHCWCLSLITGIGCCLSQGEILEAQTITQESTPAVLSQDPEQLDAPKDDWILNQPEGALAEFKMPVKPVLSQRVLTPVENQPPIKVHNFVGVFNDEKGLCLFNYHDLHQAPIETAIEEAMKEAMLQSLSNIRGRLIAEQKIRYKTNPGKAYEFRFARNEHFYKGLARIFMVGQRQYQLAIMIREDEFDQALADKFLNSFRILDPEPKTDAPDSQQTSDSPDSVGLNDKQPDADSAPLDQEPAEKPEQQGSPGPPGQPDAGRR